MRTEDFYLLFGLADNQEELLESMKELPKPEVIGKYSVPEDLNDITLEALIYLTESKTDDKFIENVEKWVLKVDEKDKGLLIDEPAEITLALTNWVYGELDRIGKLFGSTRIEPTQEEKTAGIETLNFGWFGIVDSFAKRMTITHDAAEQTKWIIIFQCMRMDSLQAQYERRLQKVYENKHKHRR